MPIQDLRKIWDDTAWRFTLILAVLIFLIEAIGDAANVSQGTMWWAAELLTAVVLARVLTWRKLRGTLSDVENMTVALAVLGIIIYEVVLSYTAAIWSFIDQPIYWPILLMLVLTVIAARLLAPYASRPLVVWVLIFSFLQFWLNLAIQLSGVTYPEPTWTWAVALTVFAIIARWIAGKGFGGPIASPLNVAVALFIFLDWWLEHGLAASGASDPWLAEDIYWPWILVNTGLAATVALAAPHISQHLGRWTESE